MVVTATSPHGAIHANDECDIPSFDSEPRRMFLGWCVGKKQRSTDRRNGCEMVDRRDTFVAP